jgi:hypothetical protein
MPPAIELHISTIGHRVSGLESRISAVVSKDHCPAIWKISRNAEVITTQTV